MAKHPLRWTKIRATCPKCEQVFDGWGLPVHRLEAGESYDDGKVAKRNAFYYLDAPAPGPPGAYVCKACAVKKGYERKEE